MKTLKYLFIMLFLVSFLQTESFAQETKDPFPPAPPSPEFDFEEFIKMDKNEEKAVLDKINSNLREKLKYIKDKNKARYFDLLRESQYKNMEFPFLDKRDKMIHERETQIFELEIASEALAAKHEKSNISDKDKIKTELKNTLNKLFDLKEESRRDEVETLEKELKELRTSMKMRTDNKVEIIKRRMMELLDEDKYLEWE